MTMETNTYPPSLAAYPAIPGAATSFIRHQLETVRKYRKYLHTVRALNACTDRVLEDNGMNRADIRAIARRDSMRKE